MTSGPVEVVHVPGEESPVLFLQGGHCPASIDCGWNLYTGWGHGLVSFSRPGYGATRVGLLSAAGAACRCDSGCEPLARWAGLDEPGQPRGAGRAPRVRSHSMRLLSPARSETLLASSDTTDAIPIRSSPSRWMTP
jgi:hypothetical protein